MSELKHFFGGHIYSDALAEPQSDLWIFGDRVITAAEAIERSASGSQVNEMDLGGSTLLPAFRDGHAHPLFAARESLGLHVTNAKSLSDIQSALSNYRDANPELTWIDGAAYDRSLTAGHEHEAAALLDAIEPAVPVILHADDHHTLWVNSAALTAAGLDSTDKVAAATAQIKHGSIDMDANGLPTGILREWEAMSLVLDLAPKPTLDGDLAALAEAQQRFFENGIVAVTDAWIDPGMAEVYIEAVKRGLLKLRVDLGFRFAPTEWREKFAYFRERRSQIESLGNGLLTAKTAKFFADGAFGSATAHVHEPYVGNTGHAGHHGQAVWSADEFGEATRAANAAGFALHIHAIGDAGVSDALDAIEAAGAPKGSVIAHTELVADGDFGRFRELGVIANFEPYWAQPNAMLTSCVPHLGQERIDRMYQMRSALAAGVTVSFGSDWPVSSFVPLEGLQVAVTRATLEAPESRWTPEEALSAHEAFHAYSSATAAQMGDFEAVSLAPGNRADFVVLDADPFAVAPESIAKINVLATYLGGQDVFRV